MKILEVLVEQLPFVEALLLCVISHTLAGAIKHAKMSDFDWKALLVGAIKFLGMVVVLMSIVVAINVYEPLYSKFAAELQTLEEAIVIGVYAKVVVLIKDYFEVEETENEHEVE